MKIISSLIVIYALTSLSILNAQVHQEWVQRYNGPPGGDDVSLQIEVDNYGNIYVAGYSYGTGTGFDFVTIKYNSSGIQQWVNRYNAPENGDDFVMALAIDSSGNVYVTGSIFRDSINVSDWATVKYNSPGVQLWVSVFNGQFVDYDIPYSIAADADGNAYVTGVTSDNFQSDLTTIKYDSSGFRLWTQTYVGPGPVNIPRRITLDNQRNVYIVGFTSGDSSYLDFVTIKYSNPGLFQWVRRFNGPANGTDMGRRITADADGNVFVTGNSEGIGTNGDYATIKYNPAGIQQWVSRYNGPGNYNDVPLAIDADNSGNIYVTGQGWGTSSQEDYTTIKYSSSGVQQWVSIYNGPGDSSDVPYEMKLDSLNNVYVTGYSKGIGSTSDYATIKYSPAGIQQWAVMYNGPGNSDDAALSMALDRDLNVYVTGRSIGSGTGSDFATIKYSQPIGIAPISNKVPDAFRLYQNYPNPFNSKSKIRFDISSNRTLSGAKGLNVKLIIYDALGREFETLVNEQLQPGTYSLDWEAANYPSGIYFYRLTAGDYTDVKKMMLVK